MAKKKSTSNYSGILRPLSQDEIDRKRVHFADFDRSELEELLIRAAHKIENIEGRLIEAETEIRTSLINARRAPDARWRDDPSSKIKALAEETFQNEWVGVMHKHGARASFIRAMDKAHPEIIKDRRTFGIWWDEWKKAASKELASSQGTPMDAESLRRWRDWRESLARLPAILKLLGYVPKLPDWE